MNMNGLMFSKKKKNYRHGNENLIKEKKLAIESDKEEKIDKEEIIHEKKIYSLTLRIIPHFFPNIIFTP
jgi:hypothetical protein